MRLWGDALILDQCCHLLNRGGDDLREWVVDCGEIDVLPLRHRYIIEPKIPTSSGTLRPAVSNAEIAPIESTSSPQK